MPVCLTANEWIYKQLYDILFPRNQTTNDNLRGWCRMKKSVLFLLTLVPVVVGYLVNVLIMIPVIGMAGFYLLPLVTTAFWIYLGKQYARR